MLILSKSIKNGTKFFEIDIRYSIPFESEICHHYYSAFFQFILDYYLSFFVCRENAHSVQYSYVLMFVLHRTLQSSLSHVNFSCQARETHSTPIEQPKIPLQRPPATSTVSNTSSLHPYLHLSLPPIHRSRPSPPRGDALSPFPVLHVWVGGWVGEWVGVLVSGWVVVPAAGKRHRVGVGRGCQW